MFHVVTATNFKSTWVDKLKIYVEFYLFLFQIEVAGVCGISVSTALTKQPGPKTVSPQDTNSLVF
jgi:hypothetical protein